jgi:citrate lyase gamma subunit
MKTVRTYSLEWLDSLISVTLNPDKPYRQKLMSSDISAVLEKVPVESLQVQAELTAQIFALNKESQVQHLVSKYFDALQNLRDAILSYRDNPAFQPEQLQGLDGLLYNCLKDLLSFIEKRFGAYIKLTAPNAPLVQGRMELLQKQTSTGEDKHKVLCTLSADQIALILRAADESQILKARSMNAVFKFIIPYLSTPHKENLSASAVRSKAYNPEEADRDAAVEALHRIIKKIQGY